VVVEVIADEITPSPRHTAGKVGDEPGYALRFPRIVSFRGADKRPEDATTVHEIAELFHQQRQRKQPA
jgi:DNA ligase-1